MHSAIKHTICLVQYAQFAFYSVVLRYLAIVSQYFIDLVIPRKEAI